MFDIEGIIPYRLILEILFYFILDLIIKSWSLNIGYIEDITHITLHFAASTWGDHPIILSNVTLKYFMNIVTSHNFNVLQVYEYVLASIYCYQELNVQSILVI